MLLSAILLLRYSDSKPSVRDTSKPIKFVHWSVDMVLGLDYHWYVGTILLLLVHCSLQLQGCQWWAFSNLMHQVQFFSDVDIAMGFDKYFYSLR